MFLVFLPGLSLLRSITDPLSFYSCSGPKMALFAVASLKDGVKVVKFFRVFDYNEYYLSTPIGAFRNVTRSRGR